MIARPGPYESWWLKIGFFGDGGGKKDWTAGGRVLDQGGGGGLRLGLAVYGMAVIKRSLRGY